MSSPGRSRARAPARPPSVWPADDGAAVRQLEREDKHAEAAQYDFFPVTFILPNEYHMFVEDFKRAPDATWIAKPIGRAQGKGIFLFNDLGSLKEWKRAYDARGAPASQSKKEAEQEVEVYIAQRYIDRPYLIGGKKFDLRLYVLVTSYSPLRVWMYRAGFARFSNHRFSMQRLDPPPPPSRTNWTRLVPPSRTNWTRREPAAATSPTPTCTSPTWRSRRPPLGTTASRAASGTSAP